MQFAQYVCTDLWQLSSACNGISSLCWFACVLCFFVGFGLHVSTSVAVAAPLFPEP